MIDDFCRYLDKAIAELAVARIQLPQYAEPALKQAREHINVALDIALSEAANHRPLRSEHVAIDSTQAGLD